MRRWRSEGSEPGTCGFSSKFQSDLLAETHFAMCIAGTSFQSCAPDIVQRFAGQGMYKAPPAQHSLVHVVDKDLPEVSRFHLGRTGLAVNDLGA
jgi:hypothetical protein